MNYYLFRRRKKRRLPRRNIHAAYSRLPKMRFSLSLSAEQCYNKADICHFRQHQYEYNRCLIFSIRVKEKQVRFLYEPVTVNGELEAMRICAVTGNRREGSLKRAEIPRTHKPGNLPVISAGMFCPKATRIWLRYHKSSRTAFS